MGSFRCAIVFGYATLALVLVSVNLGLLPLLSERWSAWIWLTDIPLVALSIGVACMAWTDWNTNT